MAAVNRAWRPASLGSREEESVLPMARPGALVLSSDEVRVALAQSAERQRISAHESDRLKRDGVAVAAAMAELCRATLHQGDVAPWTLDFAADAEVVAERCGMTLARTQDAQHALVGAAVLERREMEGATTYRFVERVWEPDAVRAAIDWNGVRSRVRSAGGAVPSCLGVLREIARATPVLGEAVSMSLSDLAKRTWFSETVVDGALRSLTAASLLERASIPRRVSQFRLLDAVFAGPVSLPSPDAPVPARPVSASPVSIPAHPSVPSGEPGVPSVSPVVGPSMSIAQAGGFVLALGGGELAIPAGMCAEVTGIDAQGRPVIALRMT